MIRIARKQAERSVFKRAKLGCVIAKGGRVLSSGWNHIGYSKYLPNRPYPESIHAEAEAIRKLLATRRIHDLVGADMYVCRVSRAGISRLAFPCEDCRELIRAVGIKRVFYTDNNGGTSMYYV